MMSVLYSVIGFLIAISVLVAVHEFGHFWVARKLGVKVLRYSIGFGKPIWKKVAGEDQIEYVVAAIPLGGYVKMLGQGSADEPVDPSERHRAFDNQPIWKRSLIVLAGPGINFLFAIILLTFLGLNPEQRLIPVFGDLPADSMVAQAGVQSGDTLVSVDGKKTSYFSEHGLHIFNAVLGQKNVELEVQNAQGIKVVTLPTDSLPIYDIKPGELTWRLGFVPPAPLLTTEIAQVQVGSPAAEAGLQVGDKFVSIENTPIDSWQGLTALVGPAAGRSLAINVLRGDTELQFQITPNAFDDNGVSVGRIGVASKALNYPDELLVTVRRSPLMALQYGIDKTWEMSALTLRMLGKMVTLQVSPKNINGPITIADVSGQALQAGLDRYISVLALISISLGVMNLLPIPMLDGGHLLMYAVEAVAGQNIAEKVYSVGQSIGVLLLICLMSLAFYNDIFRLLN